MSLTAERNEQFAEREYWEQRYADESEQDFDWFKNVRTRYVSLPLSNVMLTQSFFPYAR